MSIELIPVISKCRITFPKEIRESLNIKEGDSFVMELSDNNIIQIKKVESKETFCLPELLAPEILKIFYKYLHDLDDKEGDGALLIIESPNTVILKNSVSGVEKHIKNKILESVITDSVTRVLNHVRYSQGVIFQYQRVYYSIVVISSSYGLNSSIRIRREKTEDPDFLKLRHIERHLKKFSERDQDIVIKYCGLSPENPERVSPEEIAILHNLSVSRIYQIQKGIMDKISYWELMGEE
ncbi:AbrB/MazE/SpoVT family DNA-binding domain-containing protein [Paenibacillus polymyxa]|uniref:AbrB/MazE/SpoVT family DNA-binding domain-containing protein n=1 Tax=Paenibacillus polymyxa TaxID=1406 RepID=UPI0004DFBF48|nr:AbrB/MazE/SpoVT family DNA-binding domain-containing protein [Paenibacillus polymyxa]